jgi:hypothetical protein
MSTPSFPFGSNSALGILGLPKERVDRDEPVFFEPCRSSIRRSAGCLSVRDLSLDVLRYRYRPGSETLCGEVADPMPGT